MQARPASLKGARAVTRVGHPEWVYPARVQRRSRSWSRARAGWLAALVALAACGDDVATDRAATLRDAGGSSADADAGQRGGANRDGGPGGADAGDEDGGEPIACAPGVCDPRDPDACGAGQSCVLDRSGPSAAQAMCAPAGQGGDGAPCTAQSDCAPGYDCNASAGTGACRRYCCTRDRGSECPSGQYCGVGLQDHDGAPTGVYLCERCDACDLRDVDSCGAGRGCYLIAAGGGACSACFEAGRAALGQSCESSTDCRPGTACVRLRSQESRCTAFCSLSATAPCADGTSCRRSAGLELPAGVGLCL